jgi:D-glycero-D-manno-heptose 1,7-bisphosphate phosphatase
MGSEQGNCNRGQGTGNREQDNITPVKAVFLDRDGTINPDSSGYINHPEQFELYVYTAESIRKLHDLGFYVFIVSNQSGVARGYFTIDEVEAIHAKLRELLTHSQTYVDGIYYSPYYVEGTVEPWNREHPSRKPGIGMFLEAQKDFEFKANHSWMIGDKYDDIKFGKNAGLKTILVQTGYGKTEFMENRKNWKVKPDFIVPNLKVAVDVIEKIG